MTLALALLGLACLAAALLPRAPRPARGTVRRRRAAVPAFADALGAALAAGLSLPLALAEIAGTLPPPLDAACRRAAAALHLGDPLTRALGAFDGAVPRADLAPLALVLASFARTGGRVQRSLGRAGALVRSRLALEDERAALSAQGRVSALVLVALPPIGVACLAVLMPAATGEFLRRAPLAAVLAAALEVAGAAWLLRLARPRADGASLATLIDAVVVGLDAGLSFPAALARLAERDLAPEPHVRRLLADLALGRGTAAAFAAFATAGAAEARIAGLVTASTRLGAPLAELLVAQADVLRQEARERAHAEARRLPVLMLFPLALCILPALLIAFLGPPLVTLLG